MHSPVGIRHIPLSYNHKDSDASALHLIYALIPEWETSEGDVNFIRFTAGITNTVRLEPYCACGTPSIDAYT